MRISDWSSDVCSSDLCSQEVAGYFNWPIENIHTVPLACGAEFHPRSVETLVEPLAVHDLVPGRYALYVGTIEPRKNVLGLIEAYSRSEEHTSELQSLMRISYAVFCLKKKKQERET